MSVSPHKRERQREARERRKLDPDGVAAGAAAAGAGISTTLDLGAGVKYDVFIRVRDSLADDALRALVEASPHVGLAECEALFIVVRKGKEIAPELWARLTEPLDEESGG